jgi:nitrous oxidase accessory protein
MSSSNTQYHGNIFTENGAGVAVMYSRQIKMHDNKFTGNTGPAAYGILLKEVHESEIFNNEFKKNTVGIYMEGSNRSLFRSNDISENGWALRIMGDCENNLFTQNNFVGNTFDVTTNSDHNWNSLNENYWSHYDGYDLNRDGYGDRPYRVVSLSSVILEKVDSSYILMNSFLFNLMDQVERALPSLIPESMKDEKVLMTPAKVGVRL